MKKWTWTYICKTIIVSALILFGIAIMFLVGWEVIGKDDNSAVAIALIGAFTGITGILGWVLKALLHHERHKSKKPKQ